MTRRRLSSVPVPAFDPYTPASNLHEYDPDAYYLSSTNDHDHSMKIQTRFPPSVVASMQRLIDDETNPYDSMQDLVRDAVVHALHRRATIDPEMAQLLGAICQQSRQALLARKRDIQADVVASYERLMAQAIRDEDILMLSDLVDAAREGAAAFEDPWRRKMLEIVERFDRELRILNARRGS